MFGVHWEGGAVAPRSGTCGSLSRFFSDGFNRFRPRNSDLFLATVDQEILLPLNKIFRSKLYFLEAFANINIKQQHELGRFALGGMRFGRQIGKCLMSCGQTRVGWRDVSGDATGRPSCRVQNVVHSCGRQGLGGGVRQASELVLQAKPSSTSLSRSSCRMQAKERVEERFAGQPLHSTRMWEFASPPSITSASPKPQQRATLRRYPTRISRRA